MHNGNLFEGMAAQLFGETPLLSRLFQYVGGTNNPDFVGRGLFNGLSIDITAN